MIRHVAVFQLSDAATDEVVETIDSILATLPDIVPEIISFTSGRNAGLTEGAWDYAVVADFNTADDYTTYATNPEHLFMVKNVVGPYVVESARTQFEVI